MEIFELYGIDYDLEIAKDIIEGVFQTELVAREGLYRGGDYYGNFYENGENIILQHNYNKFLEEWTEEEFMQFPVLLYLFKISGTEAIQKQLTMNEKISLLRQRVR